MKGIFEIKSASGVRVDRDIVLSQLNSGAFDECFSVEDITDTMWTKYMKEMDKADADKLFKDIALKGTGYSRMSFDGDYHLEYVDAETVTLTRLPEAPDERPLTGKEIFEAWESYVNCMSASAKELTDGLDKRLKEAGEEFISELRKLP